MSAAVSAMQRHYPQFFVTASPGVAIRYPTRVILRHSGGSSNAKLHHMLVRSEDNGCGLAVPSTWEAPAPCSSSVEQMVSMDCATPRW